MDDTREECASLLTAISALEEDFPGSIYPLAFLRRKLASLLLLSPFKNSADCELAVGQLELSYCAYLDVHDGQSRLVTLSILAMNLRAHVELIRIAEDDVEAARIRSEKRYGSSEAECRVLLDMRALKNSSLLSSVGIASDEPVSVESDQHSGEKDEKAGSGGRLPVREAEMSLAARVVRANDIAVRAVGEYNQLGGIKDTKGRLEEQIEIALAYVRDVALRYRIDVAPCGESE